MDVVHQEVGATEELVQRIEIKDSPFQVIGTEEGYFGVMGQYRLTEVYDSKEEAINVTSSMTWNRIIQVIMLLNEKFNVKDYLENEN